MAKRRRRLRKDRIIIALVILAIIVFIISFTITSLIGKSKEEIPSSSVIESSVIEQSEESSSEVLDNYVAVSMPKSDIHKGDLALVNYAYHYVADAPSDLVTVASRKTSSYSVKNSELQVRDKIMDDFNKLMSDFVSATNLTNVMVLSGHRTVEYQQMLYNNDLARTGKNYSDEVAKPGESEHHTGLVVDLAIINSGTSKFFDASGDYAWVNENCHKYGFVVRYPESKQDITKIVHEPWHYRYVGKIHASVMTENSLCLEEYIDFTKKYLFDGEHLKTTLDGVDYEIYYIPATADTVEVLVPKDKAYTVSGNNVDGFIVTATL